jgi:hypothetical protein
VTLAKNDDVASYTTQLFQLFPADLDASVFGRCPSGSCVFGGTDMLPATKWVTGFTFQSADHRERKP